MHSGRVTREHDRPGTGALDPEAPVVALLQAVNVGGSGTVPMADLRAGAKALGFRDVRTFLATGNLLLRPPVGWSGTRDDLAAALTTGLAEHVHLPLGLVVRTHPQLDAVLAANPYPQAAEQDPSHLLVVFYDGPVPPGSPDLGRYGPEQGTWRGEEAYLHYIDGIGRSRLTGTVLDRIAGRRGTGRSWRTVTRTAALLAEMDPDTPQ